jgi:hypothetical protein
MYLASASEILWMFRKFLSKAFLFTLLLPRHTEKDIMLKDRTSDGNGT